MQFEADNDHNSKEDEEEKQTAKGCPECSSDSVDSEHILGIKLNLLSLISDWELGGHHSKEAISDWGEVGEPRDEALGFHAEDSIQVEHEASQDTQRHVHNWGEGSSSTGMVECR